MTGLMFAIDISRCCQNFANSALSCATCLYVFQVDTSCNTTLSCLNLFLAHSVNITGLKGGGVQATAAEALIMSIIQ